jgi:hypothetical protein
VTISEPCLCGDPECRRCFPCQDDSIDWDDRIAREEQKEIDRSDPVEEDE